MNCSSDSRHSYCARKGQREVDVPDPDGDAVGTVNGANGCEEGEGPDEDSAGLVAGPAAAMKASGPEG